MADNMTWEQKQKEVAEQETMNALKTAYPNMEFTPSTDWETNDYSWHTNPTGQQLDITSSYLAAHPGLYGATVIDNNLGESQTGNNLISDYTRVTSPGYYLAKGQGTANATNVIDYVNKALGAGASADDVIAMMQSRPDYGTSKGNAEGALYEMMAKDLLDGTYDPAKYAAYNGYDESLAAITGKNNYSWVDENGNTHVSNYSFVGDTPYISQEAREAAEAERAAAMAELAEIERKTREDYEKQKRAAEADSALKKLYQNELFNANGLNTGAVGQAELSRSNALAGNLTEIGTAKADAMGQIELQRLEIEAAYRQALQQAAQNGQTQEMQKLYDQLQRQEARLNQFSGGGSSIGTTQNAAGTTDAAFAQAQVDAILEAGGTPPENLIEASGYDPAYINSMMVYYQTKNAKKSGGYSSDYNGQTDYTPLLGDETGAVDDSDEKMETTLPIPTMGDMTYMTPMDFFADMRRRGLSMTSAADKKIMLDILNRSKVPESVLNMILSSLGY